MNRDNLLFLVVGVLVGFVAGFLALEWVRDKQPQRLVHDGDAPAASAQAPGGGRGAAPPGAPFPGGGGAGGGRPGGSGGVGAIGGSIPGSQGGGPAVAAVRELSERVANNPEDADALLELANMNFDIRNWPRAAELYQRYVTLRPESPAVLSDFGITLRQLERYDDAVAAFDRALAVEPDSWLALYNKLLVVGLDLGDAAGAEALGARMQALRPGDPQLEELLAEIERRQAG